MELSATSHRRSSSELSICVHCGGRNFDLKPTQLNLFHCSNDFQEHEHKVAIRVERLVFLDVF